MNWFFPLKIFRLPLKDNSRFINPYCAPCGFNYYVLISFGICTTSLNHAFPSCCGKNYWERIQLFVGWTHSYAISHMQFLLDFSYKRQLMENEKWKKKWVYLGRRRSNWKTWKAIEGNFVSLIRFSFVINSYYNKINNFFYLPNIISELLGKDSKIKICFNNVVFSDLRAAQYP